MNVFGMVAGALGIVVLARLAFGGFHHRHGWRYGPWAYAYGPGAGWGGPGPCGRGFRHEGFRHHGFRHGRGPGGWRRRALYGLFERLDATPGQEKVITSALDELREKLRSMRSRWQESRHVAAEAFRGETLTEEQAAQVFSPFASHFDELRDAASNAMRQIHDALDPKQRQILADLAENGWGFARC